MKVQLSFVIPVYNRRANLYLILHGLIAQTCKDFEVIVCDDGSDDKPLEVLGGFEKYFPVKYYRHARDGYRVSLARNQGVRLARRGTTHIWFLDSDVVLNPQAVENAFRLLASRPETVITGKYNWLRNRETTPALVMDWEAFKDVGTIADQRKGWDNDGKEVPCSGAALSGNLIIPMQAFHATGGFDEDMGGVGGEDCEFGYALNFRNFMMLLSEGIGGLHISHPATYDHYTRIKGIRETIRYIHKKYNIPLREDQLPSLPPRLEGEAQ